MEPKDYIRPELPSAVPTLAPGPAVDDDLGFEDAELLAPSVLPHESLVPHESLGPRESLGPEESLGPHDTEAPGPAPSIIDAAPGEPFTATPSDLGSAPEAVSELPMANEWLGASALPSQLSFIAAPSEPPPLVPLPAERVSALLELDSDLPSGFGSEGRTAASGEDSPSARTLEVLRAIDPADPRLETVDDPRIPAGQMYFKIGEVSKITGIKPYVLRYWEVEFPWIRPEKTSSRQRRYRRQDIALLFRISRLRYQEQLTIEETRQVIREDRQRDGARDRGARGTRSTRKRAGSSITNGPTTAKPSIGKPRTTEPSGSGMGSGLAEVLGDVVSSVPPAAPVTSEGTRDETAVFARAAQARRTPELVRALADMRTAVLELLESVEE